MASSLLYLLGAFICIQLFYYLFFFTRLAFYKKETNYGSATPGVTILVCAWNEKENLTELIPLLDSQQYPNYEVILLDDRSDDGSEEFVRANIREWKHIRYIRINDQFNHVTPKKYALTVGMRQARFPLALMTDADCRPASNHWITAMTAQISDEKGIVLGFSPYEKQPGLLNWFIRCETFYTAVQYLSFALSGLTYMGVGRNILYKRAIFFANKGFYTHGKIYGGDDDLFLNEVSTQTNTTIAVDSEAFVYSRPKTTWKSWFKQKQRHLSVGKHYRVRNKLMLGLLTGSHVAIWVIGIIAFSYGLGSGDRWLVGIMGILFCIRWLVQWFLFKRINLKLDKTVESFSFIFMDFALFMYYIIFGFLTMVKRKPRTSWN